MVVVELFPNYQRKVQLVGRDAAGNEGQWRQGPHLLTGTSYPFTLMNSLLRIRDPVLFNLWIRE
jgi:hypothetical protein